MAARTVPIFPARDLDRVIEFYTPLGFVVDSRYGDDYLIVERSRQGDWSLHFTRVEDHDPLRTASSAYVYVDDADALYAEWNAVGVPDDTTTGQRLRPPFDAFYGLREFIVVDCDGNLLRIGSPRADQ